MAAARRRFSGPGLVADRSRRVSHASRVGAVGFAVTADGNLLVGADKMRLRFYRTAARNDKRTVSEE
jgi:hypothetical protein